jgi:hypothetical protein
MATGNITIRKENMKARWFLYWAMLVSSLLAVLYVKNKKMYVQQSRSWYIGKTIIECIMLVLAAAFLPVLLVIYTSVYITRNIRKPAFKIGAGFIVGTMLMVTLNWALELVVLAGAFAVNLISDDFLQFLDERRIKRALEIERKRRDIDEQEGIAS